MSSTPTFWCHSWLAFVFLSKQSFDVNNVSYYRSIVWFSKMVAESAIIVQSQIAFTHLWDSQLYCS